MDNNQNPATDVNLDLDVITPVGQAQPGTTNPLPTPTPPPTLPPLPPTPPTAPSPASTPTVTPPAPNPLSENPDEVKTPGI